MTHISNKIRLHIPAIPYTITRHEYSHDAFTGKVKRFAPMMRSRGFEVFHYGIETSESGANKDIQLMTKDEWTKLRIESLKFLEPDISTEEAIKKHEDITVVPAHHSNWSTPLSIKFNEILRSKLKENYRGTQTDIVCIPLSRMYDIAVKDCDYVTVEFGIGYSGSYLNYRIFESYSWMSHNLAVESKCPQNYWFVIPHAFDVSEFKLSLKPNKKRIGFLGRIGNCKGVTIIVELAKQFPDIEFIICGAGDPLPFLTRPNIIYKPPIHGKERSDYLGECSAVLCPTVYLEPFGCAAVEAQLCGTPVICSDAGGMVETVEHFKSGLRCHTLADYCYGVQYALDGKFDRKYIRERAVSLYDMHKLAYKYEYIFKSVLDIHTPGKNGWYSPDIYIDTTNVHNTIDHNTNGHNTISHNTIGHNMNVHNLLEIDKTKQINVSIMTHPTPSIEKVNKKFCILLAGQMRTYESLFIKNSYMHYLSKYDSIDLYIYTWRKRGCSHGHGIPDKNIKQEDIIFEKDLISYYSKFPFFNIKQIIIDDFDIFYENLSLDLKNIYNTPYKGQSQVCTAVPICYKYQQAVESLKKFNIDYSYCMLMRPDFEFINDMPLFDELEDNHIYIKHWHPTCIDHGWFGTSATVIKQLSTIYTNINPNIINTDPNAVDKLYCNNDYIINTTRENNITFFAINGTLNRQVIYDRQLILNLYDFIDNYSYKSLNNSVELVMNNKNIHLKKLTTQKTPFSWVGYNIKKGDYILSFNILSSIDINFPFIKSHNPLCFHLTQNIKKNEEKSVSIEVNIEDDTLIIFIFDDYKNYLDVMLKNVVFKPI
jgi:glycosyltransferase involved in cell wall biosynthesis